MKVTGSLVKLTIFAVVTILATGVLAMTIGNVSFTPTASYRADFTDVTGLTGGDEVRISGVRVGEVKKIRIKNDRYAEVTFSVDKDVRIATSTLAQVRYRNLVGQRYIALDRAAPTGGGAALLRPGGLIPLQQTEPALDLTTLFNGFKPLFVALTPDDVNKLSMEIIQTLQGEGGSFDSLLATTASLTNTLADRDQVVGRVVDNLNTVLATVDQRDQRLSDLVVNMQRLVSGLAADRGAISQSIGNIDHLASSTAGLLQAIRPSLTPDVKHLGDVANTLASTRDAHGQVVLDEYLHRLPSKLNSILRTATYGSWFNFYLCDFDVQGVPAHFTQQTPSCQGGA